MKEKIVKTTIFSRMPPQQIPQAFEVRLINHATSYRVPRQFGIAEVSVQRLQLIFTPRQGNYQIQVLLRIYEILIVIYY